MELKYQASGNLESGIYELTLSQFIAEFSYNTLRTNLIRGLMEGMANLADCGCKEIYIDGSFVTKKEFPGDFDCCWNPDGVDVIKLKRLYPTLVDFREFRKFQKEKYGGEFFPSTIKASPYNTYIEYFQKDKDDNPKGIIKLNLQNHDKDRKTI